MIEKPDRCILSLEVGENNIPGNRDWKKNNVLRKKCESGIGWRGRESEQQKKQIRVQTEREDKETGEKENKEQCEDGGQLLWKVGHCKSKNKIVGYSQYLTKLLSLCIKSG